MTGQTTAGTAGAGFRADPADHSFRAVPADPGQRPACWCGRERGEHEVQR